MSTATVAPWHIRHKGKMVAWGLLGTLVAVLAALATVLPPVRAVLAGAGRGLGSWIGSCGRWLGTSHGMLGWLLLFLATACTVLLLVWLLAWVGEQYTPPALRFDLLIDGVQWLGQISPGGMVQGYPVPYCPHCHRQIRPAQQWNYRGGSWSTQLQCEDCGKTDWKEAGSSKVIYNRMARRIEALWRRGELGPEADQ